MCVCVCVCVCIDGGAVGVWLPVCALQVGNNDPGLSWSVQAPPSWRIQSLEHILDSTSAPMHNQGTAVCGCVCHVSVRVFELGVEVVGTVCVCVCRLWSCGVRLCARFE